MVIAVDLDDGCPANEKASLQARADELAEALGVTIEICFCVREFEAWYLRSFDLLAERFPELNDVDHQAVIETAHELRDAKGALREALAEGYSESIDQAAFVAVLQPPMLYQRDRAFRRLVKAVSGLDYQILEAAC